MVYEIKNTVANISRYNRYNNMPFQYFYLVPLGMYTYASLYKY